MYKRITHNITEEHFAHPNAADIKSKLDNIRQEPAPKADADMILPNLHLDGHKAFEKIVHDIRDYLISDVASIGDEPLLVQKLLKDILALGKIFNEYYPMQVGASVVDILSTLATTVVELIAKAKAGSDITPEVNIAISKLDDLAKVLSTTNPTFWPESVVKEYLHQYITSVVSQINSRIKKDWATDIAESEKATALMITGPVIDGTLAGLPEFANIFTSGIIKQFPNKFKK